MKPCGDKSKIYSLLRLLQISIIPVILKALGMIGQDLQLFRKDSDSSLSSTPPSNVTCISSSPYKLGLSTVNFPGPGGKRKGFITGHGNFKTRHLYEPFGFISLGLEACAELAGVSSESSSTQ